MSLIFKDRVKCYTNTIGTDPYSLGDAVIGYETFFDSFNDGDETCYCVTDHVDYEILTGIYSSATNSITRGSIIRTSNNNSLVNWGVGSREIFCTMSSLYAPTKQFITTVTEETAIAMAIALG